MKLSSLPSANVHIVMVGLGYIGLPTAAILAQCGYRVTGVDIDPAVVNAIQTGSSTFAEPGLDELLNEQVVTGQLSTRVDVVPADVYIIAVPTPILPDKQADLRFVTAAVKNLLPVLQRGNLIIIESTIPPGTTRAVVGNLLQTNGFIPGEDILLAHCPERVLPGKMLNELIENHRVIGGVNDASTQAATTIYASFVRGALYPTTAETAEMVKLMENTYRDVNIALANEVAKLSEVVGVNAWEVIKLANQHPRVNLHQPGPGVGGHCISVDPWFLVSAFPVQTQLICAARQINDAMPLYVAEQIMAMVADIPKPRITILGLTYKPNVDDVREAPAQAVYERLHQADKDLLAFDPFVKQHAVISIVFSLEAAVADSDLVVLMVAHDAFKRLNPQRLKPLMRHTRIYDAQNAWNAKDWQTEGFLFQQLGVAPPQQQSLSQPVAHASPALK